MPVIVRVIAEISQLKGTLLLLAGGGAYFFNDDWVMALKDILGKTLPFPELVERLRFALSQAHNPKFHEVSPEELAKRIAIVVGEE